MQTAAAPLSLRATAFAMLADDNDGTLLVQLLQVRGLTGCCWPAGGAEPVWWGAAARGHHAVPRAARRHLPH